MPHRDVSLPSVRSVMATRTRSTVCRGLFVALLLCSCRVQRCANRAVAAVGYPEPPAALAEHVRLEPLGAVVEQPLALTFAPGDTTGRLFVAEKTGRVRIIRGDKAAPTPFLDISAQVSGGFEQGLLGIAFHPKYSDNHRFFVNFTNKKGDTRVVEYRALATDPDRADPASARELLAVAQPYSNHNGGNLVFGPDGLLYIGLGDGGSANDPENRAQNDAVLLGKMLTLDVDAADAKPQIAAKGLRNPWRYSFDRVTGDLYIADVGQDHYEWVDVVPKGTLQGRRFGWKMYEGTHCLQKGGCSKDGITFPVEEYAHDYGCSITGGFVYRGKAIPELDGTYFYADYCSGLIRSFRWKDGVAAEKRGWQSVLSEQPLGQLSSFGEDAAGELYVLSLRGTVFRLVQKP